MGTGTPHVSVCIATARRSDLLAACLRSLADQQDAPPFEVLLAADDDPDVTALAGRHALDASVLQVVGAQGAPLGPADKRNLLVERARGELLLFLDDDVAVPRDLLATLAADARRHPEAVAFGGPNLTPPDSTRFQVVSGAVLGSLVTAGPSRRRFGAHPAGPATEAQLCLCNLAVRADAMRPFPSGLYTGEETVLMGELRATGGALWYDPRLGVFHERRPTFRTFVRQVFGYGRGRGMAVRRSRANLRLAVLAPPALGAYLLALVALTATGRATLPSLLPLAAYGAGVVAQAVKIARDLPGLRWAGPQAAGLIVAVHASYAVGVPIGLVRRPRLRAAGRPRWETVTRG